MATKDEKSFTIDYQDPESGERFTGAFKCKIRLSHRDYLEMDRAYRQFVGSDSPQHASPRAQNTASILAQLHVRLVEAPEYWRAAGGGMDLTSEGVLLEVLKRCLDVEKEHLDGLQKKIESAKKTVEAAVVAEG